MLVLASGAKWLGHQGSEVVLGEGTVLSFLGATGQLEGPGRPAVTWTQSHTLKKVQRPRSCPEVMAAGDTKGQFIGGCYFSEVWHSTR